MRKALLYLSAPLAVLAMAWSTPAAAQQDPFKDLDKNHWAYQAVIDLQAKGILLGYPGDYFKGKRTLTRYEFAIAIDRLLKSLPTAGAGAGPPGADGAPGAAGPPGPPGMTPDEVAELRRLISEFRNELSGLGVNVAALQKRVDALSKDVADIKDRLDKMIQFNGDVFFGFRSTESTHGFADYSGALIGKNNDLLTNFSSPHDFHLEIKAKLAGGVTFDGDLVASNYLSYQGGLAADGGVKAIGNSGLQEVTTIYKAELNIPLSFGTDSVLTVGRYKNMLTPLTYQRPNYDAYFDLPWYDDGQYISDGFKISSKLGSVKASVFASSYSSLNTNVVGVGTSNTFEAPLIGNTVGIGAFKSFNALTPFAGALTPGQLVANQSAGAHVDVPIAKVGEIGLTLMDFGVTASSLIASSTASLGAGDPVIPYHDLLVYGANFKLNPFGRFKIDGEAAKSSTQTGAVNGTVLSNDDNNAYRLNGTWSSAGIDAGLGWNYIDPRFSAPGSWLKIGDLYNLTNVQGPYARVGYNFTHALRADLSGDYLVGARNRWMEGQFGTGDRLVRGKLGVSYKINKTFTVSGDYEGVFASIDHQFAAGVYDSPIQQYFTIGAGINLTGNTEVKMAYQIIADSDASLGGYTSTNANVFTTQVAVHF